MRIEAQKTAGKTALSMTFHPESERDQDMVKVLAMMAVEGGKMRVENKAGETAVFRWGGIPGARIKGR